MEAMTGLLSHVVTGVIGTATPINLLIMFIGLVVGIVGGMLPGITTVTAVALFVPFTFSMPPAMALIGLGGVFCGAMYGGANAAILINTPGQPGAIATTLDGYPMTLQGRSQEALYGALLASVFGGIIGILILLVFFEPLSIIALKFGSEAFFWMGLFGLSTLAAMFPGNTAKGLLGGAMGLALSTIGLDPVMGLPRFTFGSFTLIQGLDMVALMIGLFSISQMFSMLESDEKYIVRMPAQKKAFSTALRALFKHSKIVTVASLIGTFIGALPGAGGSVAALISYNEAKRWDTNPDRYGQGAIEGVLVPESANNASVGGALVPLMSLGIPGSAAAAVLAGGLMAQGLTPGPQLMEKAPDIAYTFIVSMLIANIGMLLIGYLLVRISTKLLDVPKLLIIPAVISISFFGAYAMRNSLFDVLLMVLAGGIAYMLMQAKIMPAGIALGLVLGTIIEENLIVTLYRSQADDSVLDLLVFSPLSMVFIIACLLSIIVPFMVNYRKQGLGTNIFAHVQRPSLAVLRRYDFWIVLLITIGGALFFHESLTISGVSSYFPRFVYGSIVALGLFIMTTQLFERPTTSKKNIVSGCYKNIVVYLSIMFITYMLIEVLGFYAATFICVILMTAYGTFFIDKKRINLRSLCFITGYSLCMLLIEYACFKLLMGVDTPTGLWF